MAEGRLSTLQEMLKPTVVRVGGGALLFLGSYDVLCNQLGLPPLKDLISKVAPFVGMTGSLMPWWGWLLILQSLFVYALFEYVRVSIVPRSPVAEAIRHLGYSEPAKVRTDRETKEMAGRVQFICEAALRTGFRFPFRTNSVEQMYLNDILRSSHLIWTEAPARNARRDWESALSAYAESQGQSDPKKGADAKDAFEIATDKFVQLLKG